MRRYKFTVFLILADAAINLWMLQQMRKREKEINEEMWKAANGASTGKRE